MITVTRWQPLEVLVEIEQGDDFQVALNPPPWSSSTLYPCPQCVVTQTIPDTTGTTFLLTIDTPHCFPIGPLFSQQQAGGPGPTVGKAKLEVKQWGAAGRSTPLTGIVMVSCSLSGTESPQPVNPALFIDGTFWVTVEPIMSGSADHSELVFNLSSGTAVAAFAGTYSGPKSGTIRYAFSANSIELPSGIYQVSSTSPDGQWSVSGTLVVSEGVQVTPIALVASAWPTMEPAFTVAVNGANVMFSLASGTPAATFTGTFSKGSISGTCSFPWSATDFAIVYGTYSVTSTSPDGQWSVSGQLVVT